MPDRTLNSDSVDYQIILAYYKDARQNALVTPILSNIDGWLPNPADFNMPCEDD
jgi:hypothetical protein